MSTKGTGQKVYELLANPDSWIKGESCCSAENYLVRPGSPEACKFCLYGAIIHCYGDAGSWEIAPIVRKHLHDTGQLSPVLGLSFWNDEPQRRHEEVLALAQLLGI